MTTEPGLTLADVKKSPKLKREARVSDFLSDKKQTELKSAAVHSKQAKKKFDAVDAIGAEITARFGYDTYKAWLAGEIPVEKMNKWIFAERARDKERILALEGIIIGMISPTIQRAKGKPAPKSPKVALKIYKQEAKIARGE